MNEKVRHIFLLLFFMAIASSAWGQNDDCPGYRIDNFWCQHCPYAPRDSVSADTVVVVADTIPVADTVVKTVERKKGYLFALKTNLLFDLATAINVEVEVPIGKRFSIAGEWIFPDWVDRETNKYCLQTNIKSVEFRTWLGNRNYWRKLTGHYIGVYGQMGDFDFQPFTEQGFRCYDFYGGGLSYGFAHTINKRKTLSLEYGVGVGFFWMDYCTYERSADGSHLVTYDEWKGEGWYILPTKLKVSLVWLIPYSVKKKSAK